MLAVCTLQWMNGFMCGGCLGYGVWIYIIGCIPYLPCLARGAGHKRGRAPRGVLACTSRGKVLRCVNILPSYGDGYAWGTLMAFWCCRCEESPAPHFACVLADRCCRAAGLLISSTPLRHRRSVCRSDHPQLFCRPSRAGRVHFLQLVLIGSVVPHVS